MLRCIEKLKTTSPKMSPNFSISQYGGFLKIRGTFWGVLIVRILVFGGLFGGPPILGNYHIPA